MSDYASNNSIADSTGSRAAPDRRCTIDDGAEDISPAAAVPAPNRRVEHRGQLQAAAAEVCLEGRRVARQVGSPAAEASTGRVRRSGRPWHAFACPPDLRRVADLLQPAPAQAQAPGLTTAALPRIVRGRGPPGVSYPEPPPAHGTPHRPRTGPPCCTSIRPSLRIGV
jgi:hypothetical protein